MPINVTEGLAGFEEVRCRWRMLLPTVAAPAARPAANCSCPPPQFLWLQSVRALENDPIFQQAQDDALHQLYYNVSQKASAELGLS